MPSGFVIGVGVAAVAVIAFLIWKFSPWKTSASETPSPKPPSGDLTTLIPLWTKSKWVSKDPNIGTLDFNGSNTHTDGTITVRLAYDKAGILEADTIRNTVSSSESSWNVTVADGKQWTMTDPFKSKRSMSFTVSDDGKSVAVADTGDAFLKIDMTGVYYKN